MPWTVSVTSETSMIQRDNLVGRSLDLIHDEKEKTYVIVTTPVKSSCCLVSSWGGVLATSKTGGSEGRLLGRLELP